MTVRTLLGSLEAPPLPPKKTTTKTPDIEKSLRDSKLMTGQLIFPYFDPCPYQYLFFLSDEDIQILAENFELQAIDSFTVKVASWVVRTPTIRTT